MFKFFKNSKLEKKKRKNFFALERDFGKHR